MIGILGVCGLGGWGRAGGKACRQQCQGNCNSVVVGISFFQSSLLQQLLP